MFDQNNIKFGNPLFGFFVTECILKDCNNLLVVPTFSEINITEHIFITVLTMESALPNEISSKSRNKQFRHKSGR